MTWFSKAVAEITLIGIERGAVKLSVKHGEETTEVLLNKHDSLTLFHRINLDLPAESETKQKWFTLLDLIGMKKE
jgi:hypothetical protein